MKMIEYARSNILLIWNYFLLLFIDYNATMDVIEKMLTVILLLLTVILSVVKIIKLYKDRKKRIAETYIDK